MSYFGEIVEPSSRAIWDDGDDDNENIIKLQWFDETNQPKSVTSKVELFILIDGPVIADYFYCQALTSCSHKLIKKTVESSIELFELPDKILVCLCRDQNLMRSSEIVELLQDYITNADNVLAIQCQPLAEYRTNSPPNTSSLMRIIGTMHCRNNTNVKHLEQPNIISGVAAGVLSYRQFIDKEGAVYVCYIDNPQLDSTNVKEINKLLDNYNIKYKEEYQPNLTAKSNLYL